MHCVISSEINFGAENRIHEVRRKKAGQIKNLISLCHVACEMLLSETFTRITGSRLGS